MIIRSTKRTVTFSDPFTLASFGEALPAGDYIVEMDEELLDGVSFPAYRRVSTLLHLPPKPGQPGRKQVLPINPAELDAALACEKGPEKPPADPKLSGADTAEYESPGEPPFQPSSKLGLSKFHRYYPYIEFFDKKHAKILI